MILLPTPVVLALVLGAFAAASALTPTVLFVASGVALTLWAVGFIHILTKDYSKMTVTHFPTHVEELLCRLTRAIIANPNPAQRQRLGRLIGHALRLANA